MYRMYMKYASVEDPECKKYIYCEQRSHLIQLKNYIFTCSRQVCIYQTINHGYF